MRNKIRLIIITCLCGLALLCGCGKKDKKLEKYYDDMASFTQELTVLSDKMDSLDAANEDSVDTMLKILDSMDSLFEEMSNYEVPDQFASNEELSKDAYAYMHEAVNKYHQYYEDSETDINIADAALENYSRAMTRVEYISIILQGEMPEGSGVEITEEESTDFAPVTEDD